MGEFYTKSKLDNDIDHLIELGFIEIIYDEAGNELGFRVTEKGIQEGYRLMGKLN